MVHVAVQSSGGVSNGLGNPIRGRFLWQICSFIHKPTLTNRGSGDSQAVWLGCALKVRLVAQVWGGGGWTRWLIVVPDVRPLSSGRTFWDMSNLNGGTKSAYLVLFEP